MDNLQTFQSTHPTRGCDMDAGTSRIANFDFNPRTPRGGATDVSEHHQPVIFISIHAPHEGVRRAGNPTCRNVSRFQSTHPTRGCDLDAKGVDKTSKISIHAPHEGVRLRAGAADKMIIISIHAPHEGVRQEGRG